MLTLTLQVVAGSTPVHAVEVHIDLPAGMNVVAPDGTPVDFVETSGALPLVALNHVDNALGRIDLAAAYDGVPPTGAFTLATLRLRAGMPVAGEPVRLVRLPGRMTDVLSGEDSVLGTLYHAQVTASGFRLNLPVIVSVGGM